jgi:hypothetical protein
MNTENQTETNAETIRTEFARLMQKLAEQPPAKLPRTWGFELETPEADQAYNRATRQDLEHIEFHQDPSVSDGDGYDDECECQCRYCLYHDCNCDECEIEGSSDPDHDCGSSLCYGNNSEYQEIVSKGGLDTTHPEALEVLTRLGVESLEITQNCGLHIHIFSGDLTALEVSRVMTAYRLVSKVLTRISGEHRTENRFCLSNSQEEEQATRKGRETDKYRAVNTLWHFRATTPNSWNNRPATLEFRQHEGTNNPRRIRAWAWVLVQLVEFGKSGKPLYWLGKAKNLTEVLEAIR